MLPSSCARWQVMWWHLNLPLPVAIPRALHGVGLKQGALQSSRPMFQAGVWKNVPSTLRLNTLVASQGEFMYKGLI